MKSRPLIPFSPGDGHRRLCIIGLIDPKRGQIAVGLCLGCAQYHHFLVPPCSSYRKMVSSHFNYHAKISNEREDPSRRKRKKEIMCHMKEKHSFVSSLLPAHAR